jgi:hypothetical protein
MKQNLQISSIYIKFDSITIRYSCKTTKKTLIAIIFSLLQDSYFQDISRYLRQTIKQKEEAKSCSQLGTAFFLFNILVTI